jgi:hypothetical protein
MQEQIANHYWSLQAPIRLTFFFGLTAYTYVTRPGGLRVGRVLDTAIAPAMREEFAEGLSNSVVFSWAFLEIAFWFWVSGSAVVRVEDGA